MPITYWQLLAAAIVAAALLESRAPHHRPQGASVWRIVANSACLALASLLALVLAPASEAIGLWWTRSVGPGLTAQLPDAPALTLLVAFLGYDLERYAAHRLFHTAPLWRLHALHHSDPEVDWSTNFRHHPLEAIPAMLLAAAGLGLVGIDAATIALLALIHLVWDVFVHANLALPRRLERGLGWLFVTPAMHRLHHSASRGEADSNYGGMLSIWDRLFGTLRSGEPARFGLEHPEASARADLLAMLLLPFGRLGAPASVVRTNHHRLEEN